MAKWYNEKSNEEIIKKIDEIKLDVSAYAKSSRAAQSSNLTTNKFLGLK